MGPRTIFLSKLIGLFCIAFPVAMLVHPADSIAIVNAFAHNPPTIFIVGIAGALLGLAMVLTHDIWSGGAHTVVVTVLGWVILFRGLLLLSLPPATFVKIFESFHFEQFFVLYISIPLLLGLYLTWGGFRAR